MQLTPIKIRNEQVFVVGLEPMILRNTYVPNQLWLPFVSAVLIAPEPPPKQQKSAQQKSDSPSRANLENKWNKRLHRGGQDIWLYHHVPDQPVLPFPSHRKISTNEWRRIEKAGFPGFRRTKADKIAMISFMSTAQRTMLMEWCKLSCRGRYHFTDSKAFFSDPEEAVLAKLHCSTEVRFSR